MSYSATAEFLGHHPSELALFLSLLASLGLTAAIVGTERLRPWMRAGFERRPSFLGGYAKSLFDRFDEALVLLAVGLLGVFGGGSLFLHLVDWLREGTWLPDWDTTFVQTVHRHVSPLEVTFFSSITFLAGVYPPIIVGLFVGGVLLVRRHYALLATWVIGLVGNAVLVETLKRVFSRQRPTFGNPFLVESNYSFPSGHAMTSILLYGLLAYVCSKELPLYYSKARYLVIWGLTFLGAVVGTSRLVLGVHYPSDVAAGWSVGAFWLATLVLVSEALHGRFGPLGFLHRRPSNVDT